MSDPAVVEQHLAEAGHVASRSADSTVVHRGSEPVTGDLGVVLCAHRRPDEGGHQLGHPYAGGALAHPAENVGVRRAVDERAAVRPLRGQRGEIGVQAGALVVASWTPAHVALDDAHLGVGVLVCLAERDAGAHVEEVSHGGPVVTGAGDLRNVLRDRAPLGPGGASRPGFRRHTPRWTSRPTSASEACWPASDRSSVRGRPGRRAAR